MLFAMFYIICVAGLMSWVSLGTFDTVYVSPYYVELIQEQFKVCVGSFSFSHTLTTQFFWRIHNCTQESFILAIITIGCNHSIINIKKLM